MTDDRERLARAIEGRSSTKVGAIDETMKGPEVKATAAPAPVRGAGLAISN